MKIYSFNELKSCDLIIDAIYEGGNAGTAGDDPLHKIFPVGVQGGFRYSGNINSLSFLLLYTSGKNLNWPDTIDTETGIFTYYGDNRKPGVELHETSRKGNLILKNFFDSLYSAEFPRKNIPPIFIFEKHPTPKSNRSVQFKGLCVPGSFQKDSIDNLVAIWKTAEGLRFQNYRAYFTILDIAKISREWLDDIFTKQTISPNTPKLFKDWIRNGKYKPLTSQKTISFRSISQQLPTLNFEIALLKIIYNYFKPDPTAFEFLAAEIYRMTNSNIIIDEITRGVLDGGRDALGRLKLGLDSDPIFAEFALEAKCYNPGLDGENMTTVGVKETSRLISRIRNRQFGILVTTSAVSPQAYLEIRNDNHPIIFISGGDIVKILIERGINSKELLTEYLQTNYKINHSNENILI